MLTFNNVSHDPFYNQAFEEYVFNTFRDEDIIFLWRNSPSVIVGCCQNICREVSVPALRKSGIPVVRRISGGGTVYHDLGNVNYTYIRNAEGSPDYGECIRPVEEALNSLGVPARKSGVCDISVFGKKYPEMPSALSKGVFFITERFFSIAISESSTDLRHSEKTNASERKELFPRSVP